MSRRSLDLSHVLAVARPGTEAWHVATQLAQGLAGFGVRTTIAALGAPTAEELQRLASIPDVSIRAGDDAPGSEWPLFLESLEFPDVIQLFDLELCELPWRSPVVLTTPNLSDLDAISVCADAVVVGSAPDLGLALFGDVPIFFGLTAESHLLAYHETLQAATLDAPASLDGPSLI